MRGLLSDLKQKLVQVPMPLAHTKGRFFTLTGCGFLLVACTRTCVGIPELGSKQAPVKFFVEGFPQNRTEQNRTEDLARISRCLESVAGFLVQFEVAADERTVASALGRGEAHFGYMSALIYVETAQKYNISSKLVRSEKGAPSSRSVILGRTERWRQALGSLTPARLRSEGALSPLEDNRIVYTTPDSDVGFFVPRHLLLQRNVFPKEALFAGNFTLVLQALQRDLAMAGAVSESFLEQMWPHSTPVQTGALVGHGEFAVLSLSRPFPGKVVVGRASLPQKVSDAVISGLDTCSKGDAREAANRVFGGDGFSPANDRIFSYVRELADLQETYSRVLAPRENSE